MNNYTDTLYASGHADEWVIDGKSFPQDRCHRCSIPVEGRLANNLCNDCHSNVCEKADSWGGGTEMYKRFLREAQEEGVNVGRADSRR